MNGDPTTADDGAPPPRSVAEEAALLVDLLSARGPWATDGDGGRERDTDRGAGASGQGARSAGHDHGSAHAPSGTHECTCGGQAPQACRICPVCQLITFVQKVSPETVERVADLALFAASALRDLAAAQRDRAGATPPSPPPGGAADPEPSDQPSAPRTAAHTREGETP